LAEFRGLLDVIGAWVGQSDRFMAFDACPEICAI
jgi:hypothetical protein